MHVGHAHRVCASIDVPGWRCYITHVQGRPLVHVEWAVPDAYTPDGEPWVHDEHFWLHHVDTADELRRAIYTRMQFRLLHEFSHEFKVDGVPIFDQHRNPASIARLRHELVHRERCVTWLPDA